MIFLFSQSSRPAPASSKPTINWALGYFPAGKVSGAGMFDHCEELYLGSPCIRVYWWFGQRQLYVYLHFFPS